MVELRCSSCGSAYFSAATPTSDTRCTACAARLELAPRGDLSRALPDELAFRPEASRGSYERRDAVSFPSLQAFMLADRRRLPSMERDVGLFWRDAEDRAFRAAWVAATGELYVAQTGLPEDGGGHVEVLGTATDEEALRAGLSGWQAICGEPESLEWLRERALETLEPSRGKPLRRGRRGPAAPRPVRRPHHV